MLSYIAIFLIIVIVGCCIWHQLWNIAMEILQQQGIAKRYDRFSRFIKPETLVFLQLACSGTTLLMVCMLMLLMQLTMPIILVPLALAGLAIGFCLPYGYYSIKFKRRLKAIEEKFMDFLIALVDSLKAGLAMEAALRNVTEQYTGPIQEEFRQMLNEKKLNTTFQQTVARLAERNPFEDMKLFAITVRLTTNAGGKQVEVLNELIETIRQRREFEQNLKTLTADGKTQAKILSCMPFVLLLILCVMAKNMVSSLWMTGNGRICLVAVLILIGLAALSLHFITSVEV